MELSSPKRKKLIYFFLIFLYFSGQLAKPEKQILTFQEMELSSA